MAKENNKDNNIKKNVRGFIDDTLDHFDGFLDKIVKKMEKIDSSVDLRQRIISGIILFTIAITGICFFKGLFLLLVTAITIIMVSEWIDLIKSAANQNKWKLIGFVYILIPVWAVLYLHEIDYKIVLWMFSVIWATDIFAYFAGKNLGGPKLAPKISPNKTWSGLLGGIVASMIIGLLSSFMFVHGNIIFFVLISGLLAVIEQLSDLVESKFKRTFGVKDSGNIIPGHGGILDRLDGMMLVAPAVILIVWFNYSKFVPVPLTN